MAANDIAEAICARYPELKRVIRPIGYSIIPVSADFVDSVAEAGPALGTDDEFMLLTSGFCLFLRQLSQLGAITYLETEYFGGVGGQGAVVYAHGNQVVAPTWADRNAINKALAAIGVSAPLVGDRFAKLGLPAYRSNDDLLEAAHHQNGASSTPPPPMPLSLQVWLARTALVACIVLVVVLKTIGLTGEVQSVKDGDATTYYAPYRSLILIGAMGFTTGVVGVVFFAQPNRVYKFFGTILCLAAFFIFINAPTMVNHRVVVKPDSFYHRVGAWYWPKELRVDFDDVIAIDVCEAELRPSTDKRQYELRFVMEPDADFVSLPIYSMGLVEASMFELFERADARGVKIANGAQQWAIAAAARD